MRCFKNFSNLADHRVEALCSPTETADSSASMPGTRLKCNRIICPLYGFIERYQDRLENFILNKPLHNLLWLFIFVYL